MNKSCDLRFSNKFLKVEYSFISKAEETGIADSADQSENLKQLIKEYSDKCNTELNNILNCADGEEYIFAVTCGIVSELMDTIFGGKVDFVNTKSIPNASISKSIIEYAKTNSQYAEFIENRNNEDSLENAIEFLERIYHFPGDEDHVNSKKNVTKNARTSKALGLSDFCNHATPMGLICCILVQYTGSSKYFKSNADMFGIPVCVNEYGKYLGKTPAAKIFAGTVNWFFECAKVSETKKGNPIKVFNTAHNSSAVFMALINKLSSLPYFKEKDCDVKMRDSYAKGVASEQGQIDVEKFKSLFSTGQSQNKSEIKTEMAVGYGMKMQANPEIINGMLVRGVYFVKEFIAEMEENDSVMDINWSRIIPISNQTLDNMVLVAYGTFNAADIASAAERGVIRSDRNAVLTEEEFVLSINLVDIGKIALACGKNAVLNSQIFEFEHLTIDDEDTDIADKNEKILSKILKLKDKATSKFIKRNKTVDATESETTDADENEDAETGDEESAEKVEKIVKGEKKKDKQIDKINKLIDQLSSDNERVKSENEKIKADYDQIMADYKKLKAEKEALEKQKRRTEKKTSFFKSFVHGKDNKESEHYVEKYIIVSAKDPDKALMVSKHAGSLAMFHRQPTDIQLTNKNNPDITTWELIMNGNNIYRIVESETGKVLAHDTIEKRKKGLFLKKLDEEVNCLWELRKEKNEAYTIANVEEPDVVIKLYKDDLVGLGDEKGTASKWILEQID